MPDRWHDLGGRIMLLFACGPVALIGHVDLWLVWVGSLLCAAVAGWLLWTMRGIWSDEPTPDRDSSAQLEEPAPTRR